MLIPFNHILEIASISYVSKIIIYTCSLKGPQNDKIINRTHNWVDEKEVFHYAWRNSYATSEILQVIQLINFVMRRL